MNRRAPTHRLPRSASILVLTLVVIALLTLGAMAFFQRMFLEHQATRVHGRQMQTRHLAESGIDYLKYILSQDAETLRQSGGLYLNPDVFQGILVIDDPIAAFRGRLTFVAPDMTTDGYYSGVRIGGLENESTRLNLNTVLLADQIQPDDGARTLLMTLPGMTESIADAILDWIDEDDEPRGFGAEALDYSRMLYPYSPRNGPLHSIDELLMVRDVTPALLFGADLDRDMLVQTVEEPLQAIDGVDNTSGALNRGWSAYLTIDSAERNVRPDGRPKVDVNMDDLESLHEQLLEFLPPEMANFIIAYRQGGADTGGEGTNAESPADIEIDFTQEGRERLTSILDLIGVRTRIARPLGQTGGSGNQGGGDQGGGDQGGGNQGGGNQGGGNQGGGNQGGGNQGGGGQSGQENLIIVEAAFSEDPTAMQTYLPLLMDNLAVNTAPMIPGRLNVNQAPRRLLMGIPGMDSILLEQIIGSRDVQLGMLQPQQVHETWLLTQGYVDLEKMKQLLPLITSGGDVYRARVVGFYDAEGPIARLEAVIDATVRPPVVRRRWELEELGQDATAYSPENLGAQLDNTQQPAGVQYR